MMMKSQSINTEIGTKTGIRRNAIAAFPVIKDWIGNFLSHSYVIHCSPFWDFISCLLYHILLTNGRFLISPDHIWVTGFDSTFRFALFLDVSGFNSFFLHVLGDQVACFGLSGIKYTFIMCHLPLTCIMLSDSLYVSLTCHSLVSHFALLYQFLCMLSLSSHSVSYTHLTPPTKRIV